MMKYSKEDLQKIKLPLSRETYLDIKKNGNFNQTCKDWPAELVDEYARVGSEIFHEKFPDISDWD